MSTPSPWGSEFLVNTTIAGSQVTPSIVTLHSYSGAVDRGGQGVVAGSDFIVAWSGTNNLFAQRFTLDGVKVGTEQILATTPYAGSALSSSDDGGFVATWDVFTPGSLLGSPYGIDVRHGVFDANAAPVTGRLNQSTSNQFDADIARLPNESYALAWHRGDGSGTGVGVALYDGSGGFIRNLSFVTNTSGNQDLPSLAVLTNGNIVMTWQDASGIGGDTSFGGVKAAVVSASGAVVASEFLVNTVTQSSQTEPVVIALRNGNFVVAWIDGSDQAGNPLGCVKAQIFAANGARIGGEIVVNSSLSGRQTSPDLAPTIDGGFVAVWQDTSGLGGDASGSSIKGQVFDAAGAKLGSEFLVNEVTTGNQSAPAVSVLNRGQFAVTWTDSSGVDDTDGAGIKARVFDLPASPLFSEAADRVLFDVAGTYLAGTQQDALGGDDYVVLPSQGSAASVGYDVAQAFRAGAGNDVVEGGDAADTIFGDAGNDQLSGGDGNDVLIGGAGADTLLGGSGLDTVDYGRDAGPNGIAANLSAEFQNGLAAQSAIDTFGDTDTLGSIENVIGTAQADTIYGNGARNLLSGGGGDDFIAAGAGMDTIRGGAGNDILRGGEDDDVLTGGDGNDQIDGGPGINTVDYGIETGSGGVLVNLSASISQGGLAPDTAVDTFGFQDNIPNIRNVIGTARADTIHGGGHANRLEGGGGDDRLAGYLDDDTLVGGDGLDTALFTGNRADYVITRSGGDVFIVADQRSGADGTDTVSGVEFFEFADGIVAADALLNRAPTVGAPIGPQSVTEEGSWNFRIPDETFTDPDGDPLTLGLVQADGAPAPAWIAFDPATRTISGTPPANFNGSIDLRVTASDGLASASTDFTLSVTPANDAPVVSGPVVAQSEDFALRFPTPWDIAKAVRLDNLGIDDQSRVTVEFWLDWSGTDSVLFGFDGSFNALNLQVLTAPNGPVIGFNTGAADLFGTAIQGLEDGWHHVAAVFVDGNVQASRLYIDGVEQDMAQIYNGPANWAARITDTAYIGSYPPVGIAPYSSHGAYSDVRIWTGERSAADIQTLMRAPDSLPRTGLAAEYTFATVASGPGGVADTSGNGRNGTLIGLVPANVESLPAAIEDGRLSSIDALANASDPDPGDELAVVAPTGLPAGVTHDPARNTFTLDPSDPAYQDLAEGEIRIVTVSYGVTDGEVTTPASASWTVTGRNDAPVVATPLGPQSVTEDTPWSYTLPADIFFDIDGDPLALSASLADGSPLPSWLSFDAASGTFSGTPPQDFNGEVRLRVTGSDGALSARSDFTLSVTPANDAPVVSGPVTGVAQEDGAPVTLIARANATDADGDPLTIVELPSSLPAGVTFTPVTPPLSLGDYVSLSAPANSDTGISRPSSSGVWTVSVPPAPLNITSGIGYIINADYVLAGHDFARHDHVYVGPNIPDPSRATITFQFAEPTVIDALRVVQHQNGITKLQGFVGNSLSDMTSIGSAYSELGDVTGSSVFGEGQQTVFDFDNTLAGTYFKVLIEKTSLVNGYAFYRMFPEVEEGGAFTLDATHEAYQYLAEGETTTVSIQYGISDGSTVTPASLSWTVTGTNDAPEIGSGGGGDTALVAIDENSAAVTTVAALDPDLADTLTYAIVGGSDAALFAIDETTGALSFVAAPDFEAPEDAGGDNVYEVIVAARDGHGASDSQTLSVEIRNVAGVTITGTSAANTVDATLTVPGQPLPTGEEDLILGNAGADVLSGLGGNDTIDGGTGNDTIDGGAGDDTIRYAMGHGADLVNGGAGQDTLAIAGGSLNDTLDVAFDGLRLLAVEGGAVTSVERITAALGGGVNTLSYAAAGTTADVAVDLSAGTASGFASIGDITNVTGGSRNDILAGNDAANVLAGGSGNDVLTGGSGNDTLNGGAGIDTASYLGDIEAVLADLSLGEMRRGSASSPVEDRLIAIENVIGGSGDDVLAGSSAANRLEGGQGADRLTGGRGNDVLLGGAGADHFSYLMADGADQFDGGEDADRLDILGTTGNDTLDVVVSGAGITGLEGGSLTSIEEIHANLAAGIDTLSYAGSAMAVSVDLGMGTASGFAAVSGIENATGGSGNDLLAGAFGVQNILTGGGGDDVFVVHDTNDVVRENVAQGIDTVRAAVDTYTISDSDVENLTYLGAGNFSGTGNASANVLTGGAGADLLRGGGGNDTLIGGTGNDVLDGGTGHDVFVFDFSSGNDVIIGFDASPDIAGLQDLIDLRALGLSAGTLATRLAVVDLGSDTRITIDGTDTILLLGVSGVGQNAITQQDFLLL